MVFTSRHSPRAVFGTWLSHPSFQVTVPWNLLLTEILMASVVRKAGPLHGKCWMTFRAVVVGMGRSSKAECVRVWTWGLINQTSAVNWESISRKVQRWRKVCMSHPSAGWPWVSNVMQHEKKQIQPQNTSGKESPAGEGNHHSTYTRHWLDLVREWSFSSIFEKGKYKQEQVGEKAARLIIILTERSLQESVCRVGKGTQRMLFIGTAKKEKYKLKVTFDSWAADE